MVLRFSDRPQIGPLLPRRREYGCSPRRRSLTTTGTPMFVYNLRPDNTCVYPAHVRFLLQEKGGDLSGRNGKQYFRWWSNSVAHQLTPDQANLRASLTDLSQWTSVLGKKANGSAATTSFKQAVTNLGNVGFSFGGACFFGQRCSRERSKREVWRYQLCGTQHDL